MIDLARGLLSRSSKSNQPVAPVSPYQPQVIDAAPIGKMKNPAPPPGQSGAWSFLTRELIVAGWNFVGATWIRVLALPFFLASPAFLCWGSFLLYQAMNPPAVIKRAVPGAVRGLSVSQASVSVEDVMFAVLLVVAGILCWMFAMWRWRVADAVPDIEIIADDTSAVNYSAISERDM